jgi:hypothetical protein
MSVRVVRKGYPETSISHNLLTNLNVPNQHPIEAIIGLKEALEHKYEKPATGIPKTDLGFSAATEEEITALEKEVALKYQKPDTGIPETDLGFDVATQDEITALQQEVGRKYEKPEPGIPMSDLGFNPATQENVTTIENEISDLKNKTHSGATTIQKVYLNVKANDILTFQTPEGVNADKCIVQAYKIISVSLNSDNLYESEVIDASQFKEIAEISVG